MCTRRTSRQPVVRGQHEHKSLTLSMSCAPAMLCEAGIVVYRRLFVCESVCVSVCLSAQKLKYCWSETDVTIGRNMCYGESCKWLDSGDLWPCQLIQNCDPIYPCVPCSKRCVGESIISQTGVSGQTQQTQQTPWELKLMAAHSRSVLPWKYSFNSILRSSPQLFDLFLHGASTNTLIAHKDIKEC